jgi:hypothetical protein
MSLDDTEAALLFPPKEYREKLWVYFVRFAREHGAWVITPPNDKDGRVRVQLGQDSDLEKALEDFPQYRVTKLGAATRLSHGRFEQVREILVTLWRDSTLIR